MSGLLGASCLPGREGSRVNREFLVPRQSITFWKRSRERSFVFKNKRDGSPFSGKLCTLQQDLHQQHHHTAMRHFPGTCPQVMELLPLAAPRFCRGCALDHVPYSSQPVFCLSSAAPAPLQPPHCNILPHPLPAPLGTIVLMIRSSKAPYLRAALAV